MRKLAVIDYGAYAGLDTGSTFQIVQNGGEAASTIVSDFWLFIAVTALTLPVQLYLIERYDALLFRVVLGGYLVLFLLAQALMRISQSAMSRVISRKEELAHRFVRGFMELVNLRVLRSFRQECSDVDRLSAEVVDSEGRIRLVNELFFTGFALLVAGLEFVVILRQAALIRAGASTVGTLAALVLFVRGVFSPISAFSFAYVRLRMSRVPWRRLLEFLELPDDAALQSSGQKAKTPFGPIDVRRVWYSAGGRPVLQDVSMSIRPGTLTSIVGSSGAGKTTLVRILLGLLKPESGFVGVNGVSIANLDLDSLYASVALVSQDSPVLDGTVRENLFAGVDTEEAQILHAIRVARLDVVLSRLELGLDTPIGERGMRMSAGERQRLGLARALVSRAPYVFLDEPTSAMDAETEQQVMAGLLQELRGRTVLLVAHRLQPVRASDTIYVLESGTVVESGPFAELVGAGGRFQTLWEQQTRA